MKVEFNKRSRPQCRFCCSDTDQIDIVKEFQLDLGQYLKACSRCGGAYLYPDFTEASLDNFYTHHYRKIFTGQAPLFGIYTKRFFRQRQFDEFAQARFDNIKQFLHSPKTMLEIGSGFGSFLEIFSRKFPLVEAYAIEPDKRCRTMLHRSQKANFIENLGEIPDNSIDLVCSFHTFEHLVNPIEMLDLIYKKVSKNGLVVIEVPDLHQELKSVKNVHSAHVSYFHEELCFALLKSAGFSNCKRVRSNNNKINGNLLFMGQKTSAVPLHDRELTNNIDTKQVKLAFEFLLDCKTKLKITKKLRIMRFLKNFSVKIIGAGTIGELQRIKQKSSKNN